MTDTTTTRRPGARRLTAIALTVASALAPIGLGAPASAAPASATTWMDKLDEAAREELARPPACTRQAATIDLVIATTPGDGADLDRSVGDAGGVLHTTDETVGYARATLPRDAVGEVVGEEGVLAADLDGVVPLPSPPAPTGADPAPVAVVPPGADTPAANPFMPTDEIGAVAFAAAHPFDPARRVRVGLVDTGVDVGHPALQRDGLPITRLSTTTTDPVADPDPLWVALDHEVSADDSGRFTVEDREYLAPGPGAYRLGFLSEGDLPAYGEDLNGNGVPREEIAVLTADDRVWVDDDGDLDLSDVVPATLAGDPGLVRGDDPATDADEGLSFVATASTVRDDGRERHYVHIGLDQIGHGTHVAGIVAGRDLYGSPATGVAPDVDLYSIQACHSQGCGTGAMTDAVLALARDHDVDVVNMSIGSLSGLNDGQGAADIVYERIAAAHDVVLVFSAGNSGDGANTVGSPAAADRVLAVGASVSTETWRAAYGTTARPGVFSFSSRGLREDGVLRPQVVAPGAAFSAQPVAMTGAGPGAGYALKNGTSMASPMAAGGAALLLQAARADGLDPGATDVIRALTTGAAHLDGEDVTSEGAGRVDLARAWEVLRRDGGVTAIRVDAPVCTPYSAELTRPGRGGGVHQRCASTEGGPTPGHHEYTVVLTRTSGLPETREVDLRWRTRDTGLDVSTPTVALPLDTPVEIVVTADLTAGTHTTGLLEIDDPATAVVDEYLPVSIVVGDPLDPGTLSWTGSGTAEPGTSTHHYVEVPPGTALTTVGLGEVPDGSRIRFVSFWPAGTPATEEETTGCYTGDPPSWRCRPLQRTYEEAFPGVWEFSVQGSATATGPTPYVLTLTGTAGAALDPRVVAAPTEIGVPTPFETTFAVSEGVVDPSAFAPVITENRYERRALRQGESIGFDIAVPPDITSVSGRVRSMDGAVLDVETTRDGEALGHVDGVLAEEFFAFAAEGQTVHVEVTAVHVPGDRTLVWYEDRLHRAYDDRRGDVRITTATVPVPAGEGVPPWAAGAIRVSGTVTPVAEPIEGRVLGTSVRLRIDETLVLAQTSVSVGPGALPLTVDAGIPDATGAGYVVYEGDPASGVEVARTRLDGVGTGVIEPVPAPWPAFNASAVYTVVQETDPRGYVPRERVVTARVVDGTLVATFVQDPSQTSGERPPTDPGTTGSAGTGTGAVPDGPRDASPDRPSGTLPRTGPVVAGVLLLAVAALVGGLLLRRARRGDGGDVGTHP